MRLFLGRVSHDLVVCNHTPATPSMVAGYHGVTDEQERAFLEIKGGHNLVVLGQAGTGKSFLVRETQRRLASEGRRVHVAASTGIAASQFLHGTTQHHFAGILDGRFSNTEALQRVFQQPETVGRIREAELLIIDEISMLSVRIFEQVSRCVD